MFTPCGPSGNHSHQTKGTAPDCASSCKQRRFSPLYWIIRFILTYVCSCPSLENNTTRTINTHPFTQPICILTKSLANRCVNWRHLPVGWNSMEEPGRWCFLNGTCPDTSVPDGTLSFAMGKLLWPIVSGRQGREHDWYFGTVIGHLGYL